MRFTTLLVLCSLALYGAESSTLEQQYRDTAARIIGAALTDDEGYAKLAYLTDRIGHRLSGSPSLQQAVMWAAAQMKKDGLKNVTTQPVKVPHWVRGQESAAITAPVRKQLTMLGLGGSVSTPGGGITAEVVPVSSFEELTRLGRVMLSGKIVLFNVPYEGYGKTVQYRVAGASRAAQVGAAAMLLRSIGSATLQTPHTGMLLYSEDSAKIPSAAITPEDAMLIQRLHDAGEHVMVRLQMEAQTLPDAESANVMGEIPGRENPDEVVVLGGHLDSWDVGAGAQDDGSGCVAALEAVALIQKLGLRPRRTIRVVFWTNEENGLAGGRAYRELVGGKVQQHVAALEMDGGAEKPIGFDLQAKSPRALAQVREIAKLLSGIGADQIRPGGGEADIGPLMEAGVPGLGLRTVGQHYFDWHHTQADTLDKIKPQEFHECIATLAVMAYILADMPERLGQEAR